MGYQIFLEAIPLQERKLEIKKKSAIIFSTDSGKKLLFRLFRLIGPELYRPIEINDGINPVNIIFNYFADSDLSTRESISSTINNYLRDLRNNESWLDKIKNIVESLRKQRIQFMEDILDLYLESEDENQKELQNLWLNRRIDLVDF
ncbi:hypothetical protein LCGC14_0806220 [marine sediment metagenome]|uniref:Uncharacterized protein n=1 Tax=marine sediment metagenome TaxID=412755 RepID=A0A0F9Q845_9ZZZZ